MSIIKENELQQGSDAWKTFRGKGIGSSDIGTILGVNPYKTIYELFLEKTGQVVPEDISNKYYVKRGTQLEPVARNIVNDTMLKRFEPAVFMHDTHDFMRYSSDGYEFEQNEIIEIKSMGLRNHSKVVESNQIIDYYYPQIQWGLMISKAHVCWFIAYNPEHDKNIIMIPYEPDLQLFSKMEKAAMIFWDMVSTNKFDNKWLDVLLIDKV
jgi:putative phage-type endonuclease